MDWLRFVFETVRVQFCLILNDWWAFGFGDKLKKTQTNQIQLNVSIEVYMVADVVTLYLEYFLRYCKSINIAVLKLLKFLIQ